MEFELDYRLRLTAQIHALHFIRLDWSTLFIFHAALCQTDQTVWMVSHGQNDRSSVGQNREGKCVTVHLRRTNKQRVNGTFKWSAVCFCFSVLREHVLQEGVCVNEGHFHSSSLNFASSHPWYSAPFAFTSQAIGPELTCKWTTLPFSCGELDCFTCSSVWMSFHTFPNMLRCECGCLDGVTLFVKVLGESYPNQIKWVPQTENDLQALVFTQTWPRTFLHWGPGASFVLHHTVNKLGSSSEKQGS